MVRLNKVTVVTETDGTVSDKMGCVREGLG